MNKLELIKNLLVDLDKLPIHDEQKLDALQRRSEMIVRNCFGESSRYLKDLEKIDFFPRIFPADDSYKMQTWIDGKNEMLNLFKTMLEEIKLFDTIEKSNNESKPTKKLSSDAIFIVHGHNEEMKQAVARTVEKLGLEAIILHEKPNSGRTIPQKLEDLSAVGFVIVLLSGDDMAYEKTNKPETVRPRARQNVVFELGYFIGKLGKERVMSLYRDDKNFEMPSDYSGVLYEPYNASGNWKFILARELKSCGYSIDANKLI